MDTKGSSSPARCDPTTEATRTQNHKKYSMATNDKTIHKSYYESKTLPRNW